MTKAELNVLERIFAAEVANRLPFQFGKRLAPAVALKLESEGYISRSSTTLPGVFHIRIDGWQLTALGHLTYCVSCDDGTELTP